jgi:hypothetical protein
LSKETKLPAIPNSVDPAVKALKEATEVRLGRRGDPLDKGVTVRDLYEGGVVKIKGMPEISTTNSGTGTSTGTLLPAVVGGDLTTPPPVTGITVSGGFEGILIHWNQITTRSDLVAHIYRNTVDDRSTAIVVGTAQGYIYSDLVGYGKTYYYWVRIMSHAQVLGPFNGIAGTIGITNRKVSDIIAELSDSIGTSHLSTALASEIEGYGTTILQHTASIQGVSAEQYVKLAVNGAVSGYGIAAGPTGSEFAVLADVFKISNGSDTFANAVVPFAVVNGVVYMNSAMIADASIDVAKIHNLTVTTAQVTGVLTANQISSISLTSDNISANIAITAPTINGGAINSATINSSTITGGTINGVLVLAGAVALVTEAGTPHYAYDSGVYFDYSNSANVNGNHLLGVSGNIKPYNYYLTAAPSSTVKNPASNLFRYRKQSITPEMHCHVLYNQVGGLITGGLHTHFWVRAGIRTSAGTILTHSDFAITSFFDGPQSGMRNRQVVQTDSSGIYQYTLNYQFHSSTGSNGFVNTNYHMLGSQTLSIYAAHIGGNTGLNFNESTSTKCEAFVQVFNYNSTYTSIGTKSIRMHDVADNAG